MTTRPTAAIGLVALAACAGCIEGELDPKSIVNRWRVLAMEPSHPEARPGQDVSFRALVVTPDGDHASHGENGVLFGWIACIRAEDAPGLSGAQYDPEDPSEACGAAPPELRSRIPTEDDGSMVIPGTLTESLWPDAGEINDAISEMFGNAIPPELVHQLLTTVGIQVTVELLISQDGEHIMSAYKRFMLVDREMLGTNPPEPRYQVGGAWISGRDVDEPWTCEREEGGETVLSPDREIVISPDPDDEFWRETYYVLDITGTINEARERPYYSFLSTAGSFDQETTRAPVREEIWRTPADPGTYPLWLVVRDGHGGMSACRHDVSIR